MSERIASVQHNGKTVLISDFSGLMGDELMATMEKAIERDKAAPPNSRLLVDITGCRISKSIGDKAVEMGHEADRLKFKQAIVGVTGVQKVIFMAFNRKMHVASSREDAMNWLTKDDS